MRLSRSPSFRTIVLIATVLFFSLAGAGPVDAAEDWSLEAFLKQKSPWQGHGVGSSVTETTTMKMPGMPNVPNMPDVPGMPKGGKMVTTEKTTLTKITKDGFVLTIESSGLMGRKTSRTKTVPRVKNLKPTLTDGGQGTVSVGGKDYVCAIKNVANMSALFGDAMEKAPGRGKKGPATQPKMGAGKVYVHPKLGVLRLQSSMTMMGQKSTILWQVSRLQVAFKLGTQSYNCREITVTTSMSMGTSKMTMLSTRQVPGGSLKKVVENEMMGRKMKVTSEVTEYVKKPLTAITPPAGK